MFRLKTRAPANIPSMLVTAPVFQAPMSWLKVLLSANILSMLVTAAVFQEPMLAGEFKNVHPRNICDISVTPVKLGTSVAVTCRFLQFRNALCILVQAVLPHCSTWVSLLRSVPVLIIIRWKLVGTICKRIVAPVGKPVMVSVAPLHEPLPDALPGEISCHV